MTDDDGEHFDTATVISSPARCLIETLTCNARAYRV